MRRIGAFRGTIGRMTDTHAAARAWAATWQRCWEALDADPIVALYAEDATFSSHLAREAHRGRAGVREYVQGAFDDESEVRAWFGEPIVDGDRTAVSWWAALREAGEETTLAGTSVLRFDVDGLVSEQWDAWHFVAGRHDPPEGWGR
jgi:predicted SnoaL-like aldol condensation-catalyzing enzyme